MITPNPTEMTGKPVTDDSSATEQEMLSAQLREHMASGRFAEYHLEKAKQALSQQDFKTATYQVKASLCHTPQDPAAAPSIRRETVELKNEILRQARAKR